MGKVTRAEWKWVWAFAVLLAAVLLLPYVAAYFSQGGEWRFSGSLFGVSDGNSYIAKMRQGAEGAWLYRLAYTTEPQNGALIYLPYLLLGKLAGGAELHEQLVALLHLARVAAGIAMVLATYRFLACFIESVRLRRIGLLIAALGGGLGWILVGLGITPLEFYSPETFGFLSLFGPPHLAAARALLLLALAAFLDRTLLPLPARWHGTAIGFLLVALWLFQPLDVPIAWAVMGVACGLLFLHGRGWRTAVPGSAWWAAAKRGLAAVLVSAPAVLYSVAAFTLDPVLRQWTAQNITDSPAAGVYLLGYGVLLAPAVLGAWLERRDSNLLLPAGWMILLPFLIYFPMNLQRRLADGGWIALVVLALVWLERRIPEKPRRAAAILAAALCLPASILFFGGVFLQAVNPAPTVFLPAEGVRAMEWIDARGERGSVVVAGFDTGNALPAWTGLVPYIGHGPETLYLPQKELLVNTIFDGTASDSERIGALAQTGAQFVLSGPGEIERQGEGIPGCSLVYLQPMWQICFVRFAE